MRGKFNGVVYSSAHTEPYRIAKEKGTTNDPGLREELTMKYLVKDGTTTNNN